MVKEPDKVLNGEEPPEGSLGRSNGDDGSIITVLATIFLFSSIIGILLSLFPSYATDLGILPFEIGVITFALSAARTITFYQANRMEAYIKKSGMLIAGSLALGLASLIAFNSNSTLMFLVCFLIFGFGAGISYAASITLVLRWRKSSRGYAAGSFESLIGVGYFLGPLIGGFLSEFAGNMPYIYSFLLSLTVLLIQLKHRRRFRD